MSVGKTSFIYNLYKVICTRLASENESGVTARASGKREETNLRVVPENCWSPGNPAKAVERFRAMGGGIPKGGGEGAVMEVREGKGFGRGGLKLGFPERPMRDSAGCASKKRSFSCSSKRTEVCDAQLGEVEKIRVEKCLLWESQNRVHACTLKGRCFARQRDELRDIRGDWNSSYIISINGDGNGSIGGTYGRDAIPKFP